MNKESRALYNKRFNELFAQPIAVPVRLLNRRGYKYPTPQSLIENRDDPELKIPLFEKSTYITGTKNSPKRVRGITVNYIADVLSNVIDIFPSLDINHVDMTCLTIELFDKALLSMAVIPNDLILFICVACMSISGKIFLDHFSEESGPECVVSETELDIKVIKHVERLLLKRLDYNISTRYSVQWFIDYLGGYKATENDPIARKNLEDRLLDVYITGEYRLHDPFSMAVSIMAHINQ